MSKIHELLSVESNLKGQATAARTDLMATFSGKRHLFGKKIVTFKSNKEGVSPVVESQSAIQSTIGKEISWISGILAKAMDVSFQVDVANTQATADIVTESGEVLRTGVPATQLLALEKRLAEVQELIKTVPTLDPAQGFQPAPSEGQGIYQARPVSKTRTQKELQVLTLAPATDKFAAQVKEYTADVPVGTIEELEWSSMITPSLKAELLGRCDELVRAVKRARARANEKEVDVKTNTIGKTLLDWVFKPLAESTTAQA